MVDRTSIQPQPFVAQPPRYTSRPLPPYRFVPGGRWPHPVKDPNGHTHGVTTSTEPVYPAARWAEQQGYLYGIDLFNHAFWWEAHEAWEDLWHRTTDATQRQYLHGLIQLGTALLKWHLRNARGVSKLLDRSRTRLVPIARNHRSYMGLDVADLLATVDQADLPSLPDRLAEPILLTLSVASAS
jgi:predicted metal-dependent hydrolase